jgi:hypothetical protein
MGSFSHFIFLKAAIFLQGRASRKRSEPVGPAGRDLVMAESSGGATQLQHSP